MQHIYMYLYENRILKSKLLTLPAHPTLKLVGNVAADTGVVVFYFCHVICSGRMGDKKNLDYKKKNHY